MSKSASLSSYSLKWCSPPAMLRHLLICLWKMYIQLSSLKTQIGDLPLQFLRFLLNILTFPKCLCISRQGLESLLHHCLLCCSREEEISCLEDWANLLPLWAKANLGFSSTCCISCSQICIACIQALWWCHELDPNAVWQPQGWK